MEYDLEWRKIKDFPDYWVSDHGNILSLTVPNRKCRMLKLINYKGYVRVCLYNNKDKKIYFVHRLVAEAFIPNPENKPEINHLSHTTDNRKNMIEWATRQENIDHSIRVLKSNGIKGKENSQSKPIRQIKNGEVIKIWESIMETGTKGFSRASITGCCQGRRKNHKGFRWEFDNEKDRLAAKPFVPINRKCFKIKQIKDNKIIKIWEGAKYITKALGLKKFNIYESCRKKRSHAGFQWEFIKDK
jgi:hypothetical protein